MLIPWGVQQSTGRMVRVEDMPNGLWAGCVCPSCGEPLVAKNMGTVKAPHFSHHAEHEGACEGWLHATEKRLLYERIQKALATGKSIPIRWDCQNCECLHEGDLLRRARGVLLEERIADGNIRPDILLLGHDGLPCALVEIVDTHAPDPPVRAYAKCHKIPLLEAVLDSKDVGRTLAPTLEPRVSNACLCGLCPQCKKASVCDSSDVCGKVTMRWQMLASSEDGHFSWEPARLRERRVDYGCSCEDALRAKWHRAHGETANQWYQDIRTRILSEMAKEDGPTL